MKTPYLCYESGYRLIDRMIPRYKSRDCTLPWWKGESCIHGNSDSKLVYSDLLCQIRSKHRKCKTAAKVKNRKFSLGLAYFARVILRGCHYCNIPIVWHAGYSIDRKNSDLGYIKGNVVGCCKECNFIKSRRKYGEMVALSASRDFSALKKHLVKRWRNTFQCGYKPRHRMRALWTGYRFTKYWGFIKGLLHIGPLEIEAFKCISQNNKSFEKSAAYYQYRYVSQPTKIAA